MSGTSRPSSSPTWFASAANTITVIDEAEAARWRKTTEPVIEGWLKTARDKGLDGEKLLASVRAALARHEKAA